MTPPNPPWNAGVRLWSLAEMIDYFVGQLCSTLENLALHAHILEQNPNQTANVEPQYSKNVALPLVDRVLGQIKSLQLGTMLEVKAATLKAELMDPNQTGFVFTVQVLARELRSLWSGIHVELMGRQFAYIAPPADKYFEQNALFGPEVYDAFPEARADIKDAGNCIATSLYSASVFHLMRVAELGFRRLARRLRVTIKDTGKRCPLEYGDWSKVITAIKNKLNEASRLPAGPKRQTKLEMYSDAADHCLFMKDIWRNNASHTRRPYKQAEAIAAFERVRDFMQFLAGSFK